LASSSALAEVVLEGVRFCPPCEHLEGLVGKPVMRPLVASGGLRARVVVGGTINVGDAIEVSAVGRVPLRA
jgi:MOSC domain-containing protein YiiM